MAQVSRRCRTVRSRRHLGRGCRRQRRLWVEALESRRLLSADTSAPWDPANTPVADSLHRFQVNGVDGQVVGYTSIIDNTTNDGSYMLGQVAGSGNDQWLPGAAVISGANDSHWRSDVVAMNPSGARTYT